MPFAAIWMNLEIIILCEGSQTDKDNYYDITLMWNLQTDINELTYKMETDSQTLQTNLCLPKGKVGGRTDKLGV